MEKDVKNILNKYSKQLEGEINNSNLEVSSGGSYPKEFQQFKQDMMPKFSKYVLSVKATINISF